MRERVTTPVPECQFEGKRMSQLNAVMYALESRCSNIVELVDILEQKLYLILAASGPCANPTAEKYEDKMVPLAESIQVQNDRLELQISRMHDLINRIEL